MSEVDTALLRQRACELSTGELSPGGGAIVLSAAAATIDTVAAERDALRRALDERTAERDARVADAEIFRSSARSANDALAVALVALRAANGERDDAVKLAELANSELDEFVSEATRRMDEESAARAVIVKERDEARAEAERYAEVIARESHAVGISDTMTPEERIRAMRATIARLGATLAIAHQERDEARAALLRQTRLNTETITECRAAERDRDAAINDLAAARIRCGVAVRAQDAALATTARLREVVRSVVRDDSPYPLTEVLTQLADAADHLLGAHSCDAHGYEGVGFARDVARSIVTSIGPALRSALDDTGTGGG